MFDVNEPLPSSRRLYRVDPRMVNETPRSIFGPAGTWQVDASRATGRLVFTCTSAGLAICVADADGTNVRVLTDTDRADEDEPAWSPDGAQIAFRRRPQGASPGIFNPTDIWIMNADGTNQRNLTADTRSQHNPTWSPRLADGSYRIAFVQDSTVRSFHTASLYTMRPDGSDRQVLTSPGEQLDEEPTWSPDGRRVVFTRTSPTAGGDLWVVDLTTGIERPFLAQELFGAQRHPAWSPDGRHLAFTSVHEPSDDQGFRAQLYTVRADGTFLKRRTSGAGEKEHTAWLPWP
jgi:Tol biopolymer transport system component